MKHTSSDEQVVVDALRDLASQIKLPDDRRASIIASLERELESNHPASTTRARLRIRKRRTWVMGFSGAAACVLAAFILLTSSQTMPTHDADMLAIEQAVLSAEAEDTNAQHEFNEEGLGSTSIGRAQSDSSNPQSEQSGTPSKSEHSTEQSTRNEQHDADSQPSSESSASTPGSSSNRTSTSTSEKPAASADGTKTDSSAGAQDASGSNASSLDDGFDDYAYGQIMLHCEYVDGRPISGAYLAVSSDAPKIANEYLRTDEEGNVTARFMPAPSTCFFYIQEGQFTAGFLQVTEEMFGTTQVIVFGGDYVWGNALSGYQYSDGTTSRDRGYDLDTTEVAWSFVGLDGKPLANVELGGLGSVYDPSADPDSLTFTTDDEGCLFIENAIAPQDLTVYLVDDPTIWGAVHLDVGLGSVGQWILA